MELLKIQDLALHNYYIICEVIDDQMDNIKPYSLSLKFDNVVGKVWVGPNSQNYQNRLLL